MGHDAAVTKRKVLAKIEQCVAAVNEMVGALDTLEQQHNALCEDLEQRDAKMNRRLDALAAWCEQNEAGYKAALAQIDAQTDARARSLPMSIELHVPADADGNR